MRELHLFAGAGGGILAGRLLGHVPVAAVEIDPYCQAVLQARQDDGHLPRFPIYTDVRDFDGRPWRGLVDVVAGGFPCQDLSVAGKGRGLDGDRSGLWWEMHRIIREVRPSYVFLENVPAISGRGLDRVLGSLAELGFDAEWIVLSAADVGAPHLRKRWWCLARMADAEKWQGVGREGGDLAAAPEGRQGVHSSAVAGGEDAADSNTGLGEQAHEAICTRRHAVDGCGSDAADPNRAGCTQQRSAFADEAQRDAFERGCAAHSDSDCGRCSQQRDAQQSGQQRESGNEPDRLCEAGRRDGSGRADAGDAEVEPGLGRVADGMAAWLDHGRDLQTTAWDEGWEADCARVVYGKPKLRTKRLQALGNGQVPHCAAWAWNILWDRMHAT